MATRLLKPERDGVFTAEEIVGKLREEFAVVHTDGEEGQELFGRMIDRFKRLGAPQKLIDWHAEREASAVLVTVANEIEHGDAMFQFVAADECDVFVGYSSAAHEEAAKPLVRRCSELLGYEWMNQ